MGVLALVLILNSQEESERLKAVAEHEKLRMEATEKLFEVLIQHCN